MKTFCPLCQSETEVVEVVPGTMRCEASHYFQPAQNLEAGIESISEKLPIKRREQIAEQGRAFEIIAAVLALAGILGLLVFGFSFSSEDGPSWTALYVFGGCFGSALWFYLVGQIIHIRANTEK